MSGGKTATTLEAAGGSRQVQFLVIHRQSQRALTRAAQLPRDAQRHAQRTSPAMNGDVWRQDRNGIGPGDGKFTNDMASRSSRNRHWNDETTCGRQSQKAELLGGAACCQAAHDLGDVADAQTKSQVTSLTM
jgi:hypothetical protein